MQFLYSVLVAASLICCIGSFGYASFQYFKIAKLDYIQVLGNGQNPDTEYFRANIQDAQIINSVVKSSLKQKLVNNFGDSPNSNYFYVTPVGGNTFIAKSDADLRNSNAQLIFTNHVSKAIQANRQEIQDETKQEIKTDKNLVIVQQVELVDLQTTWKFWLSAGFVALILTSFFSFGLRQELDKTQVEPLTFNIL